MVYCSLCKRLLDDNELINAQYCKYHRCPTQGVWEGTVWIKESDDLMISAVVGIEHGQFPGVTIIDRGMNIRFISKLDLIKRYIWTKDLDFGQFHPFEERMFQCY